MPRALTPVRVPRLMTAASPPAVRPCRGCPERNGHHTRTDGRVMHAQDGEWTWRTAAWRGCETWVLLGNSGDGRSAGVKRGRGAVSQRENETDVHCGQQTAVRVLPRQQHAPLQQNSKRKKGRVPSSNTPTTNIERCVANLHRPTSTQQHPRAWGGAAPDSDQGACLARPSLRTRLAAGVPSGRTPGRTTPMCIRTPSALT